MENVSVLTDQILEIHSLETDASVLETTPIL